MILPNRTAFFAARHGSLSAFSQWEQMEMLLMISEKRPEDRGVEFLSLFLLSVVQMADVMPGW